MSIHLDRDTLFVKEATFGIDPSPTTMFKLGKYSIPIGDYPVVEFEPLAIYLNAHEPYSMHIASKTIKSQYTCVAVNAIPYYYILGKCAKVGDVREIEALTQGDDRPSMMTRNKSYNNAEYIAEHNLGNKLNSLTFSADFKVPSFPSYVLGFEGIDSVDATENMIAKFPDSNGDGTGTEWETSYKRDSNMECFWDGDAITLLDIAISTEVLKANIKDQDNYFPTDFYEGDFIHSVVFTVYRGMANTKAIYDDYRAQTDSTLKNMTFKIYAGPGVYLYFEMLEVLLMKPVMNDVQIGDKQVPVYTFQGLITNLYPSDLNTGIHDSFFGL